MEGMQEGDATIIKLGGEGNTNVVSFEDAFGEFSNARGKRQSKKAARKAAKQQKKLQRIANKGERKLAKQTMRQNTMEAKQGRKSSRKALRQERHTATKQARVDRRALGQEDEPMPDEQDMGATDVEQEQDNTGYEGVEESQEEPQGSGESADTSGDTWGGDQSDEGYAEEGEEESGDEGYEEEEGSGEDEEGSDGFDGKGQQEGFNELSGNVNPRILDLTKKIEWNKEFISRLRVAKATQEGAGESTAIIEGKINRLDRIKELENMLGSYSKATGGTSNPETDRHIRKARHIARNERMKLRQRSTRNGGSETIVKRDLNPEMSEQKIVIPEAESNAVGTGVTAIDDANDFDALDTRTVELQSNFDGKVGGIKVTHILIGVGLAAAGIYVYNKYFKTKKA